MLKGNYAYECIPKLKNCGSRTNITIDPNPVLSAEVVPKTWMSSTLSTDIISLGSVLSPAGFFILSQPFLLSLLSDTPGPLPEAFITTSTALCWWTV